MSTDATIHIVARAKAFTSEGARTHQFAVGAGGTVRVWDGVAGHYTRCHALDDSECMRIREQARALTVKAGGAR